MSLPIAATVYSKDGDVAVSDTVHYSIESYVIDTLYPNGAVEETDARQRLVNIVTTILKYGYSAKEYITKN